MSGISLLGSGTWAGSAALGATDEPASASEVVAYGQPRRWVVVGLAPVFVYADSTLDKPGTAGFALAVTSMWLVGVVSLVFLFIGLAQLWSLGRDRLGRVGQAGAVVSALALAAMALGNGIELYTVTARGTESDIGHTIFLIALLILIVASILLGRSYSETVEHRRSMGGSFAVARRTARNPVPGTRGRVVAGDRSRLLVRSECPVRKRQSAPRSRHPTKLMTSRPDWLPPQAGRHRRREAMLQQDRGASAHNPYR